MTPLFLLGGHDLEMLSIRKLLQVNNASFIDKELSWGARASDYRVEITDALQDGKTPVLVELTDDMGIEHHPHPDPLPEGEGGVIQIDHHGPLAGVDKPTALHQVFVLLGLPSEAWTRQLELVAANDRGHIKGMLEVGATMDEIVAIRAADRAAQGITPEQEQQAEQAIRSLEQLCEGRLTVVRLPHSRTATVADRLAPELGGIGYENLLVISPQEVNFFGKGTVVVALDNEFAGGWYGGSLPEYGFWGAPMADAHTVLTFLQELLHGKLYYTSV